MNELDRRIEELSDIEKYKFLHNIGKLLRGHPHRLKRKHNIHLTQQLKKQLNFKCDFLIEPPPNTELDLLFTFLKNIIDTYNSIAREAQNDVQLFLEIDDIVAAALSQSQILHTENVVEFLDSCLQQESGISSEDQRFKLRAQLMQIVRIMGFLFILGTCGGIVWACFEYTRADSQSAPEVREIPLSY